MILLIDNYDSFVFNLARYFERLGQPTVVVRNDAIGVAEVSAMRPDAIVLSPGPCAPQQAGCSLEVVRSLHGEVPMLGVCLGHQIIAEAFGARIVRSPEPVHGRTSQILHDDRGAFASLPNPLRVCRYHSLAVDEASLPDCLEITARTADGVIMGIEHRQWPVIGLQFHPESVLTDCGFELLAAFLRRAGLPLPAMMPGIASERRDKSRQERLPIVPVTF
ncbi:MAG TPA: aminodeoxychorismate/anthranilate synthase component II [Pirellulales bacterium]|jgi:anthranilate synthase/aminodeoxychorismate synthase-like glutamine amidotransferase|nr:aminodeoxychorismate/anthranilate synthase component II [Pirellulales bacterium]